MWTSTELNDYLDFPHVAQVFLIERITQRCSTGEVRRETVCGLTSRPPHRASPKQLLALARGHWAIENGLHWVRDVTFDEDRCRVRTGHAPQMLACLRNLVISLLRLAGARNIAAARRTLAAYPCLALRLLGL
ncbi:ISAs1 family transposase [Deferrisoma palaeochoriense]